MAIDAKELQLIVSKLSDAIAPKLKEIEASSQVRFEAALQGFRDEINPKLADLGSQLKGLSEIVVLKEEIAVHADQIKAVAASVDAASASLAALVADEITAVKQEQSKGLEGVVGRFEKIETEVGQKLTAQNLSVNTALDILEEKLGCDVEAVRDAIPELPAPLALVEDGELSSEMQKAIEVVITQVVMPLIKTNLDGAMQHCDEYALKVSQQAVEGLALLTDEKLEALSQVAVKTNGDLSTLEALVRNVTDTANKQADTHSVFAAALEERFTAAKAETDAALASVNTLAIKRVEELKEAVASDIAAVRVEAEALGEVKETIAFIERSIENVTSDLNAVSVHVDTKADTTAVEAKLAEVIDATRTMLEAEAVNRAATNEALAAQVTAASELARSELNKSEARSETYFAKALEGWNTQLEDVRRLVEAEVVNRAAAIEGISERMAANEVTFTEDINAVYVDMKEDKKSGEAALAAALDAVRSAVEAEAVNRAAAVEGVLSELAEMAPRAELVEVANRVEAGLRDVSTQVSNVMQASEAKIKLLEDAVGARAGQILLLLEKSVESLREETVRMNEVASDSVSAWASELTKNSEIFLGRFKEVEESIAVNRESMRTSLFEEMKEFFAKSFADERAAVETVAHKAALDQVVLMVEEQLAAGESLRIEQARNASELVAATTANLVVDKALATLPATFAEHGAKVLKQTGEFVANQVEDFRTVESAALREATAEQAASIAVQAVEATLAQQMPEIEQDLHGKLLKLGEIAVQTAAAQVPDLVKAEVPGIVNQIVDAASDKLKEQTVEVAKETTTYQFHSLAPEFYANSEEAAKEAGATAGKTAADGVMALGVPNILLSVRAAVLADAAIAEAARTAGGEAASVVAQAAGAATLAEATTLASSAAKAASEAAAATVEANLHGKLAAQLDPAPKLQALLDAALPGVLAEATTTASDAAAKAVEELEPRVEVRLTAKIQSAVDRIPTPRDGRDGKDGKDGKDGSNGVNGVNGKFAAPIPYVEGKTYGPGELAVTNGGLFYSLRTTERNPNERDGHGIDWQCVLNGISELEPTLESDGRTLAIHSRLSDGTFKKSAIVLPIPVARGLYKEGTTYSQHDLVLQDGSWWEAQRGGQLARPGDVDSGWKLQIKHGKDGNKGKDAAPAPWKHRGTWINEELYDAGDIVEHTGVNWLALRSTRERPPFTKLVSNDTWLKLGS